MDFYDRIAPWHVGEFEGTRSQWVSFVLVPDLAERLRVAMALGATLRVDAMHLPGIGQAAIVQDPPGAVLGLIEPGP